MSDNTSGVPPAPSEDTDDSLDAFAAEASPSRNRIDDPLEEFAVDTGSPQSRDASSPPLEWRAAETPGELVVDPPLFHPREIVFEHNQSPRRRRWIPVVTIAAVLVALSSVWWSVSRRSPAPSGNAQETPRQVESVSKAPVDVPAPPATDAPAKLGQPASKSASIDTAGVAANAAAAPATVGFSPSFAPASPGMFYHSGTGPASAIMRAETDESGTVVRVSSVVHDRSSNFHARPSPDGRWLAFDSDRDGERGIYMADVNGQGIRRVSGPGFASVPSWSPDGRRLAFVRAEPKRPRVWNIWILDLASGGSKRITSHSVGQPWGAAWFPDGTRIAYSHENRLVVRTIDGKDVRTFNSPIRGRLLRTPAVSPDGTQIIFQVHRDGAWMLDVPTGSMSPVLKDPSAEEFTWSPDGQRVAYHSRRTGTWSVWVMPARG
jgi:Tol biopolymer transport system component